MEDADGQGKGRVITPGRESVCRWHLFTCRSSRDACGRARATALHIWIYPVRRGDLFIGWKKVLWGKTWFVGLD